MKSVPIISFPCAVMRRGKKRIALGRGRIEVHHVDNIDIESHEHPAALSSSVLVFEGASLVALAVSFEDSPVTFHLDVPSENVTIDIPKHGVIFSDAVAA